MEAWQEEALVAVLAEAIQANPAARRIRLVEFPSSGHIVLIIDNAVMFRVDSGEILARKKHDEYPGPDRLAQGILIDVQWEDRSPEELLRRVKIADEQKRKIRKIKKAAL